MADEKTPAGTRREVVLALGAMRANAVTNFAFSEAIRKSDASAMPGQFLQMIMIAGGAGVFLLLLSPVIRISSASVPIAPDPIDTC